MKSNKLLSFLMSGLFALSSSGAVNNVLAMSPTPGGNQLKGQGPAPVGGANSQFVVIDCEECGQNVLPVKMYLAIANARKLQGKKACVCPFCEKGVGMDKIQAGDETKKTLEALDSIVGTIGISGKILTSNVPASVIVMGVVPAFLLAGGFTGGYFAGKAVQKRNSKQSKANSFTMNQQVNVRQSGTQR